MHRLSLDECVGLFEKSDKASPTISYFERNFKSAVEFASLSLSMVDRFYSALPVQVSVDNAMTHLIFVRKEWKKNSYTVSPSKLLGIANVFCAASQRLKFEAKRKQQRIGCAVLPLLFDNENMARFGNFLCALVALIFILFYV